MIAIHLALMFVGAVASEDRPAALVFENALYQQRMLDTGVDIDIIDCSARGSCNPPAPALAKRVVAYIASTPRNMSVLSELPNLKLYQSPWFFSPLGGVPQWGIPNPYPEAVPPGVIVANWVDFATYSQFCRGMADWVAASMFRWNFRLQEKEAVFRNCAWEADAPLSCPPLSSITGQRSLRGMTFGVVGYGVVGSIMAEVMSNLGMRVVASKRSGPFTPTPPGLAWLSGDNDRVWRESDFVVVSVPMGVSVVNKTSLALMKPHSVLINVNAYLDDEMSALYEALVSKRIGGAFIDVWQHGCASMSQTCGPPYGDQTWPSADKGLLHLDNVQLTNNDLYQEDAFWALSAKFVSDNLKALLTGGELADVVRNGNSDVMQPVTQPGWMRVVSVEKAQSLDIASISWGLSLALVGIACFLAGTIFGARSLSSLSVSGVVAQAYGPARAEYAKMPA